MSSGASTGSVNITLSGNWNLVEAVNSSGTSNVTTVYNCGTSNASNTTTLTPVLSTITGTLYVNGRGGTATNSVAGKFGELLVFSNALTDTQRKSVEGYLAWKWGLQVQTPVAPVLTPLSVPGCQLWLDAADTTKIAPAAGGTLTSWTDKSGTGKTVTVANAPTYSLTSFNGLPSVTFASGNSLTIPITAPGTNDIAMFAVWKLTDGTASRDVLSIGSPGGSETALGWNSGAANYLMYRYGGAQSTAPTSYSSNITIVESGTQLSGYRTVYINGTSPSTTGTETYNQTNTSIYIGGGGSAYVLPLIGQVAEIIYYQATLSTTQRQSVENYLMGKWGIKPSLPATHPFYSLPAFSRPFGPLDIPGCALWLDGADASTISFSSGTTISNWTDKSGNGYNATPYGTGTTVTYNSSSNAVYFPGSAGVKTSLVTPANRVQSGFFVATVSSTNVGVILGCSNATGGREFRTTGTLMSLKEYTIVLLTSGTTPVNTLMLVGYTDDGTTITHSVNGTTTSGTSATQFTSGTTVTLGYSYNTEYMVGYINEAIIFSNALSSTQRQQIEGYLAAKWGLVNNLPGKTLSPLNIPGCSLWLDAADATTFTYSSGSNVSQWRDKSGIGNHATQNTGSQQPTYTAGTKVSFNKVNNQYMSLPNGTIPYGNSEYSFYLVLTPQSTGLDILFSSGDYSTTGGTNGLYYNSSFYQNYWFNQDANMNISPVIGQRALVEVTYTQNVNRYMYSAGTLQSTTASSNRNSFSTNNIIGGEGPSPGRGYYASCDFHEFLVYNTGHTTSQRQSIENYLMAKWGISNITTHPFKSIPPSTSQPPQFQEVTPGNWKYDWQPYLQRLTAANSGATAVFSSNAVSGSEPNVNGSWSMNLAPNGLIYTFPTQNNSYIGIINPITSVYTPSAVSSGYGSDGYKYIGGGALHPNGNIYVPPGGNPANVVNVGVFTPSGSSGTFTTIASTSNAATDAFVGGAVLAPNGMIYLVPQGSAYIGRIDGNGTFTSNSVSGTVPTGNKYGGAALGPNGLIYCIPDGIGRNVGVIDPVANTYSSNYVTMVNTVVDYAFFGGVLAPNGKIYCVPFNQTTVGIIDPVANTFTNGPALSSATNAAGPGYGNLAYFGGCLGPDGNIYCAPLYANNILIINPTTNTVSYLSTGFTSPVYRGIIMAPNGKLYMKSGGEGPVGTRSVATISFTGLNQLPSSNWCLSPYANRSP
jgi:hypothetical protein